MTLWGGLIRTLLCPGFLSALLVGLLCRGLTAWLGAKLGRRPASPAWQPFADLFYLARKDPWDGAGLAAARAGWPALLAVVALALATGRLPWPEKWPPVPAELPGDLLLYLLLLAAPALARLAAAGLSTSPMVALGARRQAPIEIARLLPLFLAAAALPLASRQLGMVQEAAPTPLRALAAMLAAGVFLSTLPWPLWDRDEYGSMLAGLGGRPLALFRMVEALELSAQMGLVAVALQASSLLPAGREGWAPAVALIGTIVVLTVLEQRGQRLPMAAAVRRYTRWLLPIALAISVLGWLAGR